MIEYETLEQAMNSPYLVPTAIAAATGIVGLLTGYVSGKITGGNKVKLAQFQRDVEIARAETQKISYETDRQKILSELETKKLSIANAEEEHKRNLEKMTLQRQSQLEDEDRQRKFRQEDEDKERKYVQEARERETSIGIEKRMIEQEKLKSQGEYKLQIADKLAGLRHTVETYVEQLLEVQRRQENMFNAAEYEKKRQDYKAELVKKWEEHVEEDGDNILDDRIEIPEERINGLRDLMYPPIRSNSQQLPQIPEEIAGLIRILNQ
jgi:hypothetical protein